MATFPNSPKLIKGGIVLLDPETARVAMPKSESICEEGGSGGMRNNPEPSRDALDFWAPWEKLSFKKQMALKKMLGVQTAKGGATVDWAEPKEVAEIQRLASEAAKGDSSAIPGAVAKVKQAAEASTTKADSVTVLIQCHKPMGETVMRLVKNVRLEFQRVGPEIEGDKLWIFRSTSDKAYRLVDRPGKFHFPLKQDIRLIVINAGEGKKKVLGTFPRK